MKDQLPLIPPDHGRFGSLWPQVQEWMRNYALQALAASQAEQPILAAADVRCERQRQINEEGWTAAHDDEHDAGDLALAAAAYAVNAGCQLNPHYKLGLDEPPRFWPWDTTWWKPKTARQDLVRAGALILAEIERLDRQSIGGIREPIHSSPGR